MSGGGDSYGRECVMGLVAVCVKLFCLVRRVDSRA